MADIVIKVKTDGGEESLKNINDLKKAISSLEEQASNLDLGSDAFEKSKSQVNELKKKLNELSKSQQQLDDEMNAHAEEASAKRAERMEKVGNNLQKFAAGLTDAFAGAFIAFGAGDEDAKAFNETLQKGLGIAIGVKGGIEALVAGVQLAGPAFEAFNAVMAANPVGAIVVAIAALVAGIYFLTKALNDENEELEKQNNIIIENAKSQREALTDRYDTEIAKAQAAGKNTIQLEEEKRIAILKTLKTQLDAIMSTARANGEYTTEQIEQIKELGKEAAKIQNDATISKIKNDKAAADKKAEEEAARLAKEKAQSDANKKANDEIKEANKKLLDQIAQDNISSMKDEEARAIATAEFNKKKRDEEIKNSKASAAVKAEALKSSQTQLNKDLENINKDFKAKKTQEEIIERDKYIQGAKDLALALEIEAKHSTESRLNTLKVGYESDLLAAGDNEEKKLLITAKYIEDKNKIIKEGNDEAARLVKEGLDKNIKIAQDALVGDEDNKEKRLNLLRAQKAAELELVKGNAEKIKEINEKYTKKEEELNEELFSKKVEKINKYTQAIGAALNSVMGVFQAISDLQKQEAEQDSKERQERLDVQLGALTSARDAELEKEGLTAEQKKDINFKYAQQEYDLKLLEYKRNTEVKKKAFEQDKKLKIAQTVISTITGAVAALVGSIQSLGMPYGAIFGAIAAAAVVATGAVQVAAISKQKFDAGSPPSPPSLSLSPPSDVSSGAGGNGGGAQAGPNLYAAGQGDVNTGQGGPNGQRQGQPQKVYVVSQEVTSSQNMNAVIERRSSF